MSSKARFVRVQHVLQPLVRSVRDCWVDHQYQARLHASPKTRPTILTLYHFSRSSQHALLVALGLRLLPRRNDGNRNREQLCQRSGHSSQAQLHSRARCLVVTLHFRQIQCTHGGVPVKVGKVRARDSEQAAHHSRVQPAETLIFQNARNGVDGAGIMSIIRRLCFWVVGRIGFADSGGGLLR